MTIAEFRAVFERCTGRVPLSWQTRMYREHFAPDAEKHVPGVIDLPTGLGKTMVMAIWLIARAVNKRLPRRLIYVVDRRTVVDQATDLAMALQTQAATSLQEFGPLAVSTLRGQLADNREWSRDPSRPAIIIGTVDLIGSALLFSGYRSSFKRRPLEAGLLGQDSLLVLDEAHLSKPFESLIRSISDFQESNGTPMRVIRMSATTDRDEKSQPFTLKFDSSGNLAGEDARDQMIVDRFRAPKTMAIRTPGEKGNLIDKLADAAIELVWPSEPEYKPVVGTRIVVFVRKPDDARAIAERIRARNGTKAKPGPFVDCVEVLTGTIRGLERDELVKKPVFKERWLNGDLKPNDPANQQPAFLISTSAGEVGFDLNADHLVGDAAPLDSWVQRLGRVNRRGMGDATVILIKEPKTADKTDFDKACNATSNLFADGMDVSPRALATVRKSLTPEQIKQASSPKPTTVELTDILLDAWSMTSITERIPGRPEVGPWLRGIDDEQSQTAVVWRAEVELVGKCPDPERALTKLFAKHRIRPHECLTTRTSNVIKFLEQIPKLKGRPSGLADTIAAIRLPRGRVYLRTINQVIDDPRMLFAESTFILPATLGGLDIAGMLDAEAIPQIRKNDESSPTSLDVADKPDYEPGEFERSRLRIIIERNEGLWRVLALTGGEPIPDALDLEEEYTNSKALFGALAKKGMRVRLVESLEFNDEGESIRAIVSLSPLAKRPDKVEQLLDEHLGAVEREANRIAYQLGLDNSVRSALSFAARWHDEGKKSAIWQRFIGGEVGRLLGKAAVTRDPKSLRGYRHEFGSVLWTSYADRRAPDCILPNEPEARELALHLIATHHGFGRPHFDHTIVEDFTSLESETVHLDCLRRFARLQRKYGWWHLAWLENLLRCADGLASEFITGPADDQEDDVAEDEE